MKIVLKMLVIFSHLLAITADKIDKTVWSLILRKNKLMWTFWVRNQFNCKVIMYFLKLILELAATMEFPSSIKLTKSWTTYAKWKPPVCCAIQEIICWSAVLNAILVIRNNSVILMEVFDESKRQEQTMLCSNKALLITCSGKNSCRKGPSNMMPSPSGSNLVFMRFTLWQKHWI